MKQLIAIVLLLCLMCTSAFADGTLERTETRVVREVEESSATMSIYIQVKNTGDAPVGLDTAEISLLDSNNVLVESDTAYSMYPAVLLPGETGYISNHFYGMDAAAAQSVTGYTVTLDSQDNYLPTLQHVTHTGKYELVHGEWGAEPLVTCSIVNDTAETLWNVQVVCVVRSKEGKILDITNEILYNVGIPAGSTVFYQNDLGSYKLEKWNEAGMDIGTVETFAYIEIDY